MGEIDKIQVKIDEKLTKSNKYLAVNMQCAYNGTDKKFFNKNKIMNEKY
jgi:hypothetical protein